MAVTVKKVEYFYVRVADKPGEGRRLLEFLSANEVSLIAFTAFPVEGGRSQLDFVPENSSRLLKAASEAGIALAGPKKAFLLQGDARPGVLVEYFLRLETVGVNVHAANGARDGQGHFGFILWVQPEQYEKAAAALGV